MRVNASLSATLPLPIPKMTQWGEDALFLIFPNRGKAAVHAVLVSSLGLRVKYAVGCTGLKGDRLMPQPSIHLAAE